MPTCPNCYYGLVLLEHRRKYKCAKCGKLFPQKEIDDIEFREFNKREREKDWDSTHWLSKEEYKKNMKERHKKWYEKNKEKVLAQNKERRRQKQKEWNEKHPDYNSKNCKIYYQKNKEKILAKQKEYRKKSGQVIKARLERLKKEDPGRLKFKGRMNYWRMKQKLLTQEKLKNGEIKPFTFYFEPELPTYPLSYLLLEYKHLNSLT